MKWIPRALRFLADVLDGSSSPKERASAAIEIDSYHCSNRASLKHYRDAVRQYRRGRYTLARWSAQDSLRESVGDRHSEFDKALMGPHD